jgi:hypothetical protein
MRYEITPAVISFFIENPKKEIPSVATLSCEGLRLTDVQLVQICSAISKQAQGKRHTTQRNYLSHFLRPLLAYFKATDSTAPVTTNEWQLFLLHFLQYYLTDAVWTQAAAKTRMEYWSTLVSNILEFWAADDILPCGVTIPVLRLKHVQSNASSQRLLGETEPIATAIATRPQKLLVSVEFGEPGAVFLDAIERSCREKIGAIKDVCLAHWDALMLDGQSGSLMADMTSTDEIAEAVRTHQYAQQIRGGSLTPMASPAHPLGHSWALAISRELLRTGDNQDCVTTHALMASKFFAKKTFHIGYQAMTQRTAMPLDAFNQYSTHGQYCRFAGILSSLDAAAACCLLTIEHPEFTSDALQSAKLLNARGKSHLLLTDNSESSILSLDKPRAGQRKTVTLTPLAQRLLKDIVVWTAPVRAVLKKAGDKSWRFLFLGFGRSGRLVALDPTVRHLGNGKESISLTRLYPVLAEQGVTTGNFDYRRIRTTMGVLRWFETGSIQEMSRRLGNTNRVVLEHYLPPALLHAWNTRIIRRFQNTLIVLAAQGEDYLLEVTDFSSVSDLQHFIAQLVLEYPGNSSPLAKEVQGRLLSAIPNEEGADECAGGDAIGDGILNIRLSAVSLGYLYAFSDFATSTLSQCELNRVDTLTKLAPVQFVDLARLIRHACENEKTTADLRELLDLPRLRDMHTRAKVQQVSIGAHLTKLSVDKQWGLINA